jgi:hypothetical protein
VWCGIISDKVGCLEVVLTNKEFMAAKDIIHDPVREALENDGWEITDDPLTLLYKDKNVFIDLGAQRLIAARRDHKKIAVEIKSFIGLSIMRDLELALGQYVLYRSFLNELEPDRHLYIALSHAAFLTLMRSEAIQMLLRVNHVSLLVVNLDSKEIVLWSEN